jgi:exonuclease VII large subunit
MLHEAQIRLLRATQMRLQEGRQRVEMAKRLLPDPQRVLGQANQSLGSISDRLLNVSRNIIQTPSQKLEALSRVLQAHHPEAPLARGYALVWQGENLVDINTPAGDITLQFAAGKRAGVLK